MKVLIATEKPFAAAAVKAMEEVLTAGGIEVAKLEKYTEKKQLLEAVADADGIIIRSDIVDAEVLDAAKNLKLVVRAGAGYDNIDLAAATAHNVVAMNTPGQNANAVAPRSRLRAQVSRLLPLFLSCTRHVSTYLCIALPPRRPSVLSTTTC